LSKAACPHLAAGHEGRNRRARRAAAKRGRQQVFEMQFFDREALLGLLRPDRPITSETITTVMALVAIKAGGKHCMACDAPLARGAFPGSVMVCSPFAAPIDVATVGGVCVRCESLGPDYVKVACIAQFRESGAVPDAREIVAGRA
jgi:hypothetical protein